MAGGGQGCRLPRQDGIKVRLIDSDRFAAIDRAALIAADHAVIPLAPELFSIKLAPTRKPEAAAPRHAQYNVAGENRDSDHSPPSPAARCHRRAPALHVRHDRVAGGVLVERSIDRCGTRVSDGGML